MIIKTVNQSQGNWRRVCQNSGELLFSALGRDLSLQSELLTFFSAKLRCLHFEPLILGPSRNFCQQLQSIFHLVTYKHETDQINSEYYLFLRLLQVYLLFPWCLIISDKVLHRQQAISFTGKDCQLDTVAEMVIS